MKDCNIEYPISYGDLSGSKNLYLEIKNKLKDTPFVISLGDIIGDRNPYGIEIINDIFSELRSEFKKIIIAGNHENIATQVICNTFIHKDEPITGDEFAQFLVNIKRENNINGLVEYINKCFHQKFSTIKEVLDSKYSFSDVLPELKQSEWGREHLKNIQKLKLGYQYLDHLYIHTDPTKEIAEILLKNPIEDLNKKYQESLGSLLWEKHSPSLIEKHLNITYTFLHNKNRRKSSGKKGLISNELSNLLQKKLGIKKIIHGHSKHKNPKIKRGGVEILTLDTGAGKTNDTMDMNTNKMIYNQYTEQYF